VILVLICPSAIFDQGNGGVHRSFQRSGLGLLNSALCDVAFDSIRFACSILPTHIENWHWDKSERGSSKC
jgi:hypothetical protein